MELKDNNIRELGKKIESDIQAKIPIAIKVFCVLIIVFTVLSIARTSASFWKYLFHIISTTANGAGLSTAVCEVINLVAGAGISICNIFLSIMLLASKKKESARFIYVLYLFYGADLITYLMLNGIGLEIIFYIVGFVILVALQIYLDPTLGKERSMKMHKIEEEWHEEQDAGTIGFDSSGKGAIEINFFNLFWIFLVCSIIGLVAEELYHYFFVVPGELQDRAGLLFGPFSPIYGCGAVIMTVALNRLHKYPIIVIFLASAIIGGLFEVVVSYFMEYTFGAVAWNYSSEVLPLFGGRTCAKFMIMWGFMGAIWLKIFMPTVVKVVNKIPWNWRCVVTAVATILMVVDVVMTLQSLDCWYMRISEGEESASKSNITQFYATNFDDDYMENRFESMTINPGAAVRNN